MKFEYQTFTIQETSIQNEDHLSKFLTDKFGKEGWELTNVTSFMLHGITEKNEPKIWVHYRVFFKRLTQE